jgi:hypothetical protein
LAAALVGIFVWPGEAQQSRNAQDGDASATAPVQLIANNTHIDAGMRIIHMPQAGDLAAYPQPSRRPISEETRRRPKADSQRIAMPKPPQPRRILPPPATKRAVLSAPPPAAEGPTPIRPTPRWTTTEKFTVPAERQTPVGTVQPALDPTGAIVTPNQPDTVSQTDDDSPPPTD